MEKFLRQNGRDVHRSSLWVAVMLLLQFTASTGCSQGDSAATASPSQKTHSATHAIPTAQESKSVDVLLASAELEPWKFIVLHHSATEAGSVASIDQTHKQRRDSAGNPWLGIGYHFVIGNGNGMEDGEVASTFRWDEQISGAHAGSRAYNDVGIGICLIGNFENQKPTKKQVNSAAKLVSVLRNEFGIAAKQVLKHGDFKATACPGRQFPFEQIVSSHPHGTEGTQQHTQVKTPAVFQPVAPGLMEEVRNVAAFSRSRFGTRSATTNVEE